MAVARGSADAAAGEDYGFILLRRGDVTRKIPYEFFVGRPQLELLQPKRLERFQLGDTVNGPNRVSAYCCPSEPFGPPPDYVGPPMSETGTETLYVTTVNQPVANVGVAIEAARAGSSVDPWFLGSPNERDVQGYAGTPVNVNELMVDFSVDIGAAGASFPKVQRFYVSVDSGSDDFTHRSLPGSYVLRSWVNDVRRRTRATARELVAELKSRPCPDCGGHFPPVVMDFDHVKGNKRGIISRMTSAPMSGAKLLEEIAKCEVVCANCHRRRNSGRAHVRRQRNQW